MKTISVIIPVYGVEDYLRKCLDSVVKQTLKDFEIIIVNDGSPDNSQLIIDEYEKKYSNIHAYIKENGGLSDARNYGLKYAKGEYISFIDSDDYIREDMLEKMYNQAKEQDSDIVVCDCIKAYENGTEEYCPSNLNYSNDIIRNYLISQPMATIRIYRKNLFENIKFQKDIYYEDLNLTPKLVNYTNKISFINEGFYYYYQRTNSIMKEMHFNKKQLVIFDILDSIKNSLDMNVYYQEVEYLYITHLLRTASLRFIDFKETKIYLKKINNIFRHQFPHWKNNPYFKQSSYKYKLVCFLSYHRLYSMLKIIKKVSGK